MIARLLGLAVVLAATGFLLACTDPGDRALDPSPTTGGTEAEADDGRNADPETPDARQGGMTTSFDDAQTAFTHPARNLSLDELRLFAAGDEIFEGSFDEAGGLGPDFDSVGCTSCHVNDGRGPGPDGDGPLPESMVVKVVTDDPGVLASVGTQLQRRALEGLVADGEVSVRYETVTGEYGDGTPYALRRPVYEVGGPAAGGLPDATVLSVRNAPPLVGMGLLEQIAVEDLHAHADPDDRDDDGISGRPGEAHVPFRDESVVGRFGWQASAASVEHQIALALIHDLGITTSWFPSDRCQDGPDGCPASKGPVTESFIRTGEPLPPAPPQPVELDDRSLFELTLYTLAVAVPARRDLDDPEVQRGEQVFGEVGCASCHAGPFTTGDGDIGGLSSQTIDPGTDLLLYDLGPELADRTLDDRPVATEWRAAPLWGLGLADEVLGSPARYLHDGRARTVAEAILWHGGEASTSRERFRHLTAEDREALLAYLASR